MYNFVGKYSINTNSQPLDFKQIPTPKTCTSVPLV